MEPVTGTCVTGFSQEGASAYAIHFSVWHPTPSRLKPVPLGYAVLSGTGFSREEASAYAIHFSVWHPTPSRLKPVPLRSSVCRLSYRSIDRLQRAFHSGRTWLTWSQSMVTAVSRYLFIAST
jgi:hypothetical protein